MQRKQHNRGFGKFAAGSRWRSPVRVSVFAAFLVMGMLEGLGAYQSREFSTGVHLAPAVTRAPETKTPDPAAFLQAYPWQRVDARSVSIYYPQNVADAEIAPVALGFERMLHRVTDWLQVSPPTERIKIFLFPNAELHGRLVGSAGADEGAYTLGNTITMVYAPWQTLRGPAAHELTHAAASACLADGVDGLIDEGLADTVEEQLAKSPDDPMPRPTTMRSLRELANSDLFYDWREAAQDGGSYYAHYSHAHSLVRYLIARYGLAEFERFYVSLASEADSDAGIRLSHAVRDTFAVSLPRLESQWRAHEARAVPAAANEILPEAEGEI